MPVLVIQTVSSCQQNSAGAAWQHSTCYRLIGVNYVGGPACLVALCLSSNQHLPIKLLRLLQVTQPSQVEPFVYRSIAMVYLIWFYQASKATVPSAGADQCHVCSMQSCMRRL